MRLMKPIISKIKKSGDTMRTLLRSPVPDVVVKDGKGTAIGRYPTFLPLNENFIYGKTKEDTKHFVKTGVYTISNWGSVKPHKDLGAGYTVAEADAVLNIVDTEHSRLTV